jgi:hypothetical protein
VAVSRGRTIVQDGRAGQLARGIGIASAPRLVIVFRCVARVRPRGVSLVTASVTGGGLRVLGRRVRSRARGLRRRIRAPGRAAAG